MTIYAPNFLNIEHAAQALKSGELIGFPTETVYGLGADACNEKAVAAVFALKGRPSFNPLISHVSSLNMALEYGEFSPLARKIAEKFWPNALTIIVPRKCQSGISDLTCAGLETIALRFPKHKVAQDIINAFGGPIAAPSANISGKISPTSALHVANDFGDNLPIIIDGGECELGLESSVIAVFDDEITLLRLGIITQEEIETTLNHKVNLVNLHDETSPKSPGMLLRHYSPNAPLILNANSAESGEILIGFGEISGDFNLSKSGNLTEAAANLYRFLRAADEKSPKAIKIAPIPKHGIGLAISDRLLRAATKTPLIPDKKA